MERYRLWREPTLIIAAVASLINLLVTFNLHGLSAVQAALLITLVNAAAGVTAAVMTRPIAPQAFTYFFSSLAAFVGAYGFNISAEQLGSFQVLVLAILALMTRNQVSPVEDAHKTGVLGNTVVTGQ